MAQFKDSPISSEKRGGDAARRKPSTEPRPPPSVDSQPQLERSKQHQTVAGSSRQQQVAAGGVNSLHMLAAQKASQLHVLYHYSHTFAVSHGDDDAFSFGAWHLPASGASYQHLLPESSALSAFRGCWLLVAG